MTSPKKILVVDDDAGARLLVEKILRSQQYDVIFAEDGLEALVKIKQERPDLVVLDVMMPEINGYDVCYQLRFNKDFERLPIILLTVRDQELDSMISDRVNIEYIPKPLNSVHLVKKVEELLKAKS